MNIQKTNSAANNYIEKYNQAQKYRETLSDEILFKEIALALNQIKLWDYDIEDSSLLIKAIYSFGAAETGSMTFDETNSSFIFNNYIATGLCKNKRGGEISFESLKFDLQYIATENGIKDIRVLDSELWVQLDRYKFEYESFV